MNELLEFQILVTLHDEETKKLINMGIDISEDSSNDKFVKYSFDASTIVEIRQTFVKYKEEWIDAVVCTYTNENFETPPLIVHYDEFKRILNEYNKKNA